MHHRIWAALAATLLTLPAVSAEPTKYGFGALTVIEPEVVQRQARAWLDGTGRIDEPHAAAFDAIWADADRAAVDRLADTFALTMPDLAAALADARNDDAAAPKELPALFKEAGLDPFVRSNAALAYAKALVGKKVYEEGLDALRAAVPERTVDPAAYYFHKAVAEHGLVRKSDALRSIQRMLDDVSGGPERYIAVAELMVADLKQWKDEDTDLEQIARVMDSIERRLDLSRGGPKTQEMQKKVLFRIDELIKDIENQLKNGGQSAPCPGGEPQPGQGQGGTNQPLMPQDDSRPGNNSGPGNVDPKKLKGAGESWGGPKDKAQADAGEALREKLPTRYRGVIEKYSKSLADTPPPSGKQPK